MEPSEPLGTDAGANTSTPHDYSKEMYHFYFELIDHAGLAKEIISRFLGERHARRLTAVSFGYELDMPIQSAPDLIRLLVRENIAVYQVVRLAKTSGVWRPN